MTELTAREYGFVIAALEAYAEDFPDAEDAAELSRLADLFTHNTVTVTQKETNDE